MSWRIGAPVTESMFPVCGLKPTYPPAWSCPPLPVVWDEKSRFGALGRTEPALADTTIKTNTSRTIAPSPTIFLVISRLRSSLSEGSSASTGLPPRFLQHSIFQTGNFIQKMKTNDLAQSEDASFKLMCKSLTIKGSVGPYKEGSSHVLGE